MIEILSPEGPRRRAHGRLAAGVAAGPGGLPRLDGVAAAGDVPPADGVALSRLDGVTAGRLPPADGLALPRLDGVVVALHDNAKPGAETLLGTIGAGLHAHGAVLRRWGKAHAARPTTHVPAIAREARAAVFALGD